MGLIIAYWHASSYQRDLHRVNELVIYERKNLTTRRTDNKMRPQTTRPTSTRLLRL